MSHQTVHQATMDSALQNRISAAVQKEVYNNVSLKDTEVAKQFRQVPLHAVNVFIYPVAIDYETEYEYAVESDNPNPGGDPTVITDGNLTAAIVTHWPPDPTGAST